MVKNNKSNAEDVQITRTLANFAADLEYEDLSPEVVDWAKYLCLDFAGVTLNGSMTDSAKAVVQAFEGVDRSGPSPVIGTGTRSLPEYAALANGTAFHSIEMDDVYNEAVLHPGVTAYPTALALADMAEVSGKDFISAVVAGYDVIGRLGRALKGAEHYARGSHPTGTCGTFGAAAVSARLLGLRGDDFVHALGIAGSQTSGSLEYLAQGAWTKRLHPGWASHSGICAGLLAKAGFTGPTTILEGRDGFLAAYSGDPDPSLVLKDLSDDFLIARTSVKPHACCRWKHGPIDCLLDLNRTYGTSPHGRGGGAGWRPQRQHEADSGTHRSQANPQIGSGHAVQHALRGGSRPDSRTRLPGLGRHAQQLSGKTRYGAGAVRHRPQAGRPVPSSDARLG
ncbi:MAG: MmgE/PrpD family protein [Chloroflexota bacterium]|nr:MmgE/PrpD family protein [Chloroflexota bacterium]